MNRAESQALLTTGLLPIIMCAVWFSAPLWIGLLLLAVCPIMVLWLVWTVLHDTAQPPGELPHGHEWDYLDRPDLAERD